MLRFGSKATVPTEDMDDRPLYDTYDADIMNRLHHNSSLSHAKKVLWFTVTCDGTEVEKGVSYTPVVLRLLNLPPQLRHPLGNLKLAAFFPPKIQSYDAHLQPFVEQLARHQPNGGEPIRCWDAASGSEIQVYTGLTWTQVCLGLFRPPTVLF
jgi:hypothetical protein